MTIGDRLREERTRLGLSQPKFAEIAGTTKQTLFSWESNKTAPDAHQLASFALNGVDVFFVLTGERLSAQPAADASEQLLLDNFRRCKLEAKQNLLQSSVLYAAGMPPASAPKPVTAPKTRTAAGSMNMSNLGSGNVQIGTIGGDYNPASKPARKRTK
ncbi:helix-turn-helix domain-containing protein [Comamonas fluminis]|uniref:helix-turn-helix domain-containing protein n=1 Tax=Comamonas fluminis TaxID=2796366 RepID=UPI001C4804CD|nr:helix-turn-helix transcriptional regulator [Comamonas fluminis]